METNALVTGEMMRVLPQSVEERKEKPTGDFLPLRSNGEVYGELFHLI